MKDNLIVKRNDLLKVGYSLSMNEQRILLACISQIDSRVKLEEHQQFEITVQEIIDIFGSSESRHFYAEMTKAVDRLFDRRIVFREGNRVIKLRWVWKIEYIDDEATIRLNFSPDVIPYLSEITKNFTQYKLEYVKDFKCIYSLRLYELFAQYQVIGRTEIEVDELRRILDLRGKYSVFGEFKRSVIDKAITEINALSNISVAYGCRKRGCKVMSILFEFKVGHKRKEIEHKTTSTTITMDEFVRNNPGRTKGKSEIEVRKMMAKA